MMLRVPGRVPAPVVGVNDTFLRLYIAAKGLRVFSHAWAGAMLRLLWGWIRPTTVPTFK